MFAEVSDDGIFTFIGCLFCETGDFGKDYFAHNERSYCFETDFFQMEVFSCNGEDADVSMRQLLCDFGGTDFGTVSPWERDVATEEPG